MKFGLRDFQCKIYIIVMFFFSTPGNRTIFIASSPYTVDVLEDFNGQITVAG